MNLEMRWGIQMVITTKKKILDRATLDKEM